jgi:hypothetical protein
MNLITVPSCPRHNNRNSLDVEYVRNLICSDLHVNEVGLAMFETARRSYERRPALFRRTFARYRLVVVNGEETFVYQVNLTRFKRIIRAIANALYFHEFGEKFRHHWHVYNATMISQNQGFRGLLDRQNPQLRAMLRNVPAAERHTNQPEVFRYGLYRGQHEHEVLYRLLFYGGVDIYVFGAAPE